MYGVLIGLGILLVIWVAWRLVSRKKLLPCPAFISWLVEMENPFARVTRSERIIQQLGLGAGARVADIGCGPGRITIPLARAVGPNGEVFAVDVQVEMLVKVARKAEESKLPNIRPLLCDVRERCLPEKSLNGAVLVMTLGEIPEHPQVCSMIYAALKDGGRLLLSESVFDPHYIRKKKLIELATLAGFVERSCVGNFFAYTIVFEKQFR